MIIRNNMSNVSFQILFGTFCLLFINLSSAKCSNCTDFNNKIEQLESIYHVSIGVYALNTNDNSSLAFNEDNRFPFCSTSKFIVAAAILKASESNSEYLNQKISYSKNYVQQSGYSPISARYVESGMNVSELIIAALDYSDNTAMNLLISHLGGLSQVNRYAHSLYDTKFRLDRTEPQLNSAVPGDHRDTTTPRAMTMDLQKLLLGNQLKDYQKQMLTRWMKDNTTGDKRIRAGVPKNWTVADKTGSGDYGTANDIGIIYPPNCKPIALSIFTTSDNRNIKYKEDVIAKITSLLLHEFAKTDQCLQNNM